MYWLFIIGGWTIIGAFVAGAVWVLEGGGAPAGGDPDQNNP